MVVYDIQSPKRTEFSNYSETTYTVLKKSLLLETLLLKGNEAFAMTDSPVDLCTWL